MVGLEQWRASIGLYHSGSNQLICALKKRKLPPTTVYQLLQTLFTVLVLVLLLGGLTCITKLITTKNQLLGSSGTCKLVIGYVLVMTSMEAHSSDLERSIRAVAILLIMAGDVEQNPGPLPPASASPESRALRHHFASLVTAITDPLILSLKLFSTGMIDLATKDKANLPIMTTNMRNDVLLSAVISRVDTDSSLFHQFVNLLKDDGDDILKSLGGRLEDTYDKFTKDLGETEEYALSLSHKNQPELSTSHTRTQVSHSFPTETSQSHHPLTFPQLNSDSNNFPLPSQPLPHPQLEPSPSHLSYPLHSQPPSQPSQSLHPSTLPQPTLDPYNFADFQMHIPLSQHPPPHPHLIYYLPQPYMSTHHPMHYSPTHAQTHHPSPSHPPPLQPTKQFEQLPPLTVTHTLPQSLFLLFVSYLKSFYNSDVPLSYCKWPPVQNKKFINLAVISREKVSSKELKQFMLAILHGNVDQILEIKGKFDTILNTKPGEKLHCVLIEGAPGVGKTTLAWEICKQWARGELFQQYRAIMLLRLRDHTVQNAKNFTDLIFYNEDNEGSRIEIYQYMKHINGEDILVILEGLDEFPKHLNENQPSIFTCLLSRQILPDATILVTSRPSATVHLQKGWTISQHIEVLGFSEKDITDYIQSALSPQELPVFDSYLSTYPNIRLTMYIPLNCAIVTEVYRSCQQSSHPPPTTTTELYTCLVKTIVLRYLDSHPDYKNDETEINKFTDLPPLVYNHFYKLAEMAYHGVQSQQLIFYDQHKGLEHLGFMDAVAELFPSKRSFSCSYNFLHLSIQEYLAAYFVSLKSKDVQQQQMIKTMCTEQHLRNMGLFLAGLTRFKGIDRATVETIIKNECKLKWSTNSLKLSPYTLQLIRESGDYSIICGYSSYSCRLTDHNPLLDFSVLGHCIANSSYMWRLALGEYISQHMQCIQRIDMLVQTLKSHSNPSYTIERIECYYEVPECVQHLLLELPQYALQQIQILVLYNNCNNIASQPLPQHVLEHILSKISRLHSLELNYGAVSTSGVIAVADMIKNNSTLQYVGLIGNNIGNEGIKALDMIKEVRGDLRLDYN